MLKKDHREVAAMLKTLADSKPGARRQATVKKLSAALRLHMSIEERDGYPLVAKEVGEEDAEEAEVEHGLAPADRPHEDGRTGRRARVRGAAVDMVAAGIKHHVKGEETEIFPELKRGSVVIDAAASRTGLGPTQCRARRGSPNGAAGRRTRSATAPRESDPRSCLTTTSATDSRLPDRCEQGRPGRRPQRRWWRSPAGRSCRRAAR